MSHQPKRRPKRPPRKRHLTELAVRKARPESTAYFGLGRAATWSRSSSAAYRREELGGRLQPPRVGTGEREFTGGKVGDACIVKSADGRFGAEGAHGTLQLVEGELVCIADSKLSDAMRDEREAAHLEYQNRIQSAWRDGR